MTGKRSKKGSEAIAKLTEEFLLTEQGILAAVRAWLGMPLPAMHDLRELQRKKSGRRDPMFVALDTVLMVRHVLSGGVQKYEAGPLDVKSSDPDFGKVLDMIQALYTEIGGIRKEAEGKRVIGSKTEERLQNLADELESSVIALGEELGWELDDVIAGDGK